MESKLRRSRLAKDDKNEDASTDTPNIIGHRTRIPVTSSNVMSNTKPDSCSQFLDQIYNTPVITPKKTKKNTKKSHTKSLKQDEILQEFEHSEEELFNSPSKNNNTGAKEETKVDKQLSETRSKRHTVGIIKSYNEDELMHEHQMICEKTIALATPSKSKKYIKAQASKNVAETSPRKRSKQNSPEQHVEGYGVDENEMSHANLISSPPKRPKSETEIEQTPKKKSDFIDEKIKSTPGRKRRICLSETEKMSNNPRLSTRKSTYNSEVNYKELSSSDDNMMPQLVLDKVDQSLTKKAYKQSSKNVEEHFSEDSETENKWSGNRPIRSRSKLLQAPAKHLNESIYSPIKDMQNLKITNDAKTSKIMSTPSVTESNTDEQGLRRSLRIHKKQQLYDLPRNSDEENGDSSEDYKTAMYLPRNSDEENGDSSEDYKTEEGSSDSEEVSSESETPRKNARTPKANRRVTKVSMHTPTKAISRMSLGTPTLDKHRRITSIIKPSTPLQEARAKLHASVLPKSLPCREEQFNDIYSFLHARLSDGSGGCIYISGVPGTGKTATVSEVVCCLKKSMIKGELPEFQYIDINGMKLSEPRQAYVQIWKQMSGETKTWEESHKLLQNKFNNPTSKRCMTLLLVDELDLLCTKRQDVVYNLLDWPSKTNAKLVVVTIANTMDLPERILMGKVTSRLGLTRLTFPPYNFKQLEEIVVSRLRGFNPFGGETIQLVARKVAAVSGDARRALDICRRSAEIAEHNKRELVSMIDVKQALEEMIASPKIQAIKHCSEMEQFFLQAMCAEVYRTGIEEVVFKNVYMQMETLCTLDGKKTPNVSVALEICARLGSYRLLLCDHSRMDIHQRLLLNVSTDDVHFATKKIDA